ADAGLATCGNGRILPLCFARQATFVEGTYVVCAIPGDAVERVLFSAERLCTIGRRASADDVAERTVVLVRIHELRWGEPARGRFPIAPDRHLIAIHPELVKANDATRHRRDDSAE